MTIVRRTLVYCGLLLWSGYSAAQSQELPSAPSSTLYPSTPQAPATQPKHAGDPAADKAKPELESLEKQKPASAPLSPVDEIAPPPDPGPGTPAPPEPHAKTLGKADAAVGANPDDFTVKRKVEEVNVIFTVTDKHGHFIKDLKQDQFSVMDDNRPAEAIRGFTAETNLPLRVGLLIDVSSSIRERFKFEQQAATEFLNQIVRPVDAAFVIGFDTTPEVTQDFTNSTELLSDGIRMLRPGGGTALFDAVYYTCRDKLMKHPDRNTVRRAIILLSDGDDNQSRVTREEAIEMAQRAEVVIYTISTNLADKGRGDKILERMADATGGRAFSPFKIEDVSDAFSQIQAELRSQYAVAYKPADFVADGRYRSIDIVPKQKKLKVRSRKGYYAPKG